MALLLSVLMFVFVMSLLYFFGMKLWVSPQNVVERVLGEARQTEARHPSLAFRDVLTKLGDFVPSSPADLSLTQKRLYAAGFRTAGALKTFLGVKALLTLLMPLAAWLATSQLGLGGDHLLLLCVLAAGLGYLGPNEALGYLVSRRRKRIQKALPNGLDLLVVCVESGLGLDQAIMQVSRELQQGYPELSSELAICNLEMRHGKRRSEALRNLGERSGVDDMKKLVSTLIQADRFGTSLAQSLRTHSEFMRLTARQRAEEQAAKIGIKLVFPIFFCILPSLFVVTVGPVVVRILTELIPMMTSTS
ncbi:MAG: type II secretion system F family protein [Acidobacteria bacterium]|nr:type II secretion system F family protein [Acidobacteriota bacterium]